MGKKADDYQVNSKRAERSNGLSKTCGALNSNRAKMSRKVVAGAPDLAKKDTNNAPGGLAKGSRDERAATRSMQWLCGVRDDCGDVEL